MSCARRRYSVLRKLLRDVVWPLDFQDASSVGCTVSISHSTSFHFRTIDHPFQPPSATLYLLRGSVMAQSLQAFATLTKNLKAVKMTGWGMPSRLHCVLRKFKKVITRETSTPNVPRLSCRSIAFSSVRAYASNLNPHCGERGKDGGGEPHSIGSLLESICIRATLKVYRGG